MQLFKLVAAFTLWWALRIAGVQAQGTCIVSCAESSSDLN